MATINSRAKLVTLINVFTVEPNQQQELAELLTGATQQTMQYLPGFISASIHKSSDGSRVVNYAQWRSAEDFAAMQQNPEAHQHMKRAAELATSFEPKLYEVISVHNAGD